jgi:hypothetical protein
VELDRLDPGRGAGAHAQVEHLDHHREGHRRVDVALRHVVAEGVGHQHHADHQQERQRQHLDGGVARDELADRAGGDHHQAHRGDHRGHHHRQVVHHADGGDDGVEREHDVDHDDLRDHRAEGGLDGAGGFALFAFHQLVHLLGALPDQEQAAAEQDQVAAGEAVAEHGDHRFGHAGHPRQGRQQGEAHEHRQEQAEPAGEDALLGRQLVHQDGDEDHVVDTQHQLEGGEGEEGDQQLRVGQEFHFRSMRCGRNEAPPGGAPRMVA